MKADFSGNFLNVQNAFDGDIITIVGKATIEEKRKQNGDVYFQTNIPVLINGKQKVFSPSRETGLKFVRAWGDEMDAWIEHKATIRHVLKQVKGITAPYIEAEPLI